MSRSGYCDDIDDYWAFIRHRGAVKSSLRGKRGQEFLKELAAAMDAMPEKILIASELKTEDGAFCTLGVVGQARGIDMTDVDPEDYVAVASKFGIAEAMAREIVFENDEAAWHRETPEERWSRMRQWVAENIIAESEAA